MNQDKVKELLLKYVTEENQDFSVIFTGKESNKIDGLYNRETKEILIHNRNFKSDNELFYTALHELAHHLIFSEKDLKKGSKHHTKEFYMILNDLVDKSIMYGDYQDFDSDILKTVVESGKEYTRLLKRIGKELVELYDLCMRNNIPFEDIVLRKTGMTGAEAKSIMKMYAVDVSEELPGDLARKVAKIKDVKERKEAEEKKIIKPAKAPKDPVDEETFLTEEKKRLERKIERELNRVEEINLLLEGLQSND